MIEKWKTAIDNGGVFAALLTDFSEAFDCIPHDLIIAKLAAYGFDTNPLRLIHNYLSTRKQRVKINSVYSICKDISYGVPQGSILEPLLFNIHLCDLFYFLENTDIASYANDNTLCSAQKNREAVINTIETSSQVVFDWFSDNFMKANSGKRHLLMSGTETTHANFDGSMIKSSQREILFGINIDSELKFEDHVNFMCKKVSQKLYAPSRIAPEMYLSIHHRNIQKLVIEIYKVLHGFSPPILNDIFVSVSRPYNFRRNDTLQRRRVNSVRHGKESVSFLGPKIWDLVPSGIKLSQSLSIFKRKIKKWMPLQCPCRLCKIYL